MTKENCLRDNGDLKRRFALMLGVEFNKHFYILDQEGKQFKTKFLINDNGFVMISASGESSHGAEFYLSQVIKGNFKVIQNKICD